MTSLLLKVALAAALTVGSVLGLVGISGFIIFADLAPEPASLAQGQSLSGSASAPLSIVGPHQ